MDAAPMRWSKEYDATSFDGVLPRLIEPEILLPSQYHLSLNGSIALNSLELPQGAKILAADMEAVVVECIVPVELPEEGAAAAAAG